MYAENEGDEGEDVVTPGGLAMSNGPNLEPISPLTAIEKNGGRCQPRKKSL